MNLWRLTNIDKYLYEIIDSYKHSKTEEERDDIFKSFCSSIWSCDNKRKVITKTIRYNVKRDLLETDVGLIFETWSEVKYKGYKSMTKDIDWCSLIRQKINNLYTRYFDKDVILKKDYMYELGTPKRLYYQWLNGVVMSPEDLTIAIDDAIAKAINLKEMYQKQKMNLKWNNYKTIIEEFLRRTINNCKLIEEYEDKNNFVNMYDFMNEDNFYIKYFCKCLEGEMRKWQKKYYNIREHKNYRRCQSCGDLFELRTYNQYRCPDCQSVFNRKNKTEKQRKYRVEKLKT